MTLRVAGAATLALLIAGLAFAQRGGLGDFDTPLGRPVPSAGGPYDGRFAFVRLTYDTLPGGYWYRGQPAWSHGYPTSELNLLDILKSITIVDADRETKALSLEDPAIFEYPVLYIIEVSWWRITDAEARNLRAFLDKGGFVIVDDFKTAEWRGGRGWAQFADNMSRVLPDAQFVDLDVSHPIFHQFFTIGSLDIFRRRTTRAGRSSAASTRTTTRRSGCGCSSATTPTFHSSGSGRAAASVRSTTRTRRTSSASTPSSTA